MGSALGVVFFALAHGFLYLGRAGNFVAVRLLRLAVRVNPRHHRARAWSLYLSALRAMETGEPEASVKLLREALKEAPGETPIRGNLGIALTMAGRHQEAAQVLRGVLKEDADVRQDPQVWRALAWCLVRTGQPAEATRVLSDAAGRGLRNPDLQVLGEFALLALGNSTGESLERLLRSRPRMLPLALEFGEAEAAAGRFGVAREVVNHLPAHIREDGLRIMAGSRLNADDLTAAQALTELLEQISPGSIDARLLRAELAARRGMYQKSVDIALSAAEADPDNARALHQLGLSLLYAGQPEDAAKQFSLAMAVGSGSALAGGVVALQLLEAGKMDDARKVFVHQRAGDALGCAYAFSAQALLMAGSGEWGEFGKLTEWADEAWKDIPEALRTAPVTAPLIAARAKVQEARAGHERGTHADS